MVDRFINYRFLNREAVWYLRKCDRLKIHIQGSVLGSANDPRCNLRKVI